MTPEELQTKMLEFVNKPRLKECLTWNTRSTTMIVRKVRGQDKVGKIILTRTQIELVQKAGVPLKLYVRKMLDIIAKQRKWKWYFKQEKT